MKKFLLTALAIIMAFSMFACTNNNDDNNDQGGSNAELAANASLEDIAKALMNTYAEYTNIRATYDDYMVDMPEEEQISYEEFLSYQLSVMPVEAGYLPGFTTEIGGFKSGAMFAPMIGSIPFVGYVFELESEDDVEAFLTTLKDTSDPRWNVCVEADETVMGNYGTKVFFVMCPTSIEG